MQVLQRVHLRLQRVQLRNNPANRVYAELPFQRFKASTGTDIFARSKMLFTEAI
jgi:hypothetical protein